MNGNDRCLEPRPEPRLLHRHPHEHRRRRHHKLHQPPLVPLQLDLPTFRRGRHQPLQPVQLGHRLHLPRKQHDIAGLDARVRPRCVETLPIRARDLDEEQPLQTTKPGLQNGLSDYRGVFCDHYRDCVLARVSYDIVDSTAVDLENEPSGDKQVDETDSGVRHTQRSDPEDREAEWLAGLRVKNFVGAGQPDDYHIRRCS
mmetsp:Transcript_4714/g.11501  ORF Transcript_4714/g.11501 Transcript_4714/m.11501 type:complete len:200 (+) Transcript_4714:1120-1719(+)